MFFCLLGIYKAIIKKITYSLRYFVGLSLGLVVSGPTSTESVKYLPNSPLTIFTKESISSANCWAVIVRLKAWGNADGSVSGQHYSKTYERIGMNFYDGVLVSTMKN